MVLVLGRGLDKPPPRLAALVERVLIALTHKNTKAGVLRTSRAHLSWSTFDLMSPAMPTFLASQIPEVIRGCGEVGCF